MPSRTGVPPVLAARTVNCPYIVLDKNGRFKGLNDPLLDIRHPSTGSR